MNVYLPFVAVFALGAMAGGLAVAIERMARIQQIKDEFQQELGQLSASSSQPPKIEPRPVTTKPDEKRRAS